MQLPAASAAVSYIRTVGPAVRDQPAPPGHSKSAHQLTQNTQWYVEFEFQVRTHLRRVGTLVDRVLPRPAKVDDGHHLKGTQTEVIRAI